LDSLDERVRQLEARLGLAVVLRPVHVPDPTFRGRIERRGAKIVIEYRDDTPGFFWHHDKLRELLDCIERGEDDVFLYDENEDGPTDAEPL